MAHRSLRSGDKPPATDTAPAHPVIFKGPPSSVIPHSRRRDIEDLDTVRSRTRTLASSVLNSIPCNYPHAILALEVECPSPRPRASREGPSARIPHPGDENAAWRRRERVDEARMQRDAALALAAPSNALTRVMRTIAPNSPAALGWCKDRDRPLQQEDLWKDGVGPTPLLDQAGDPEHMCSIFRTVKSHAVSYVCGHSGRLAQKDLVDFAIDESHDDSLIADREIYFSSDGKHRQEERLNVTHKKRCVAPTDLEDSWGEWVPVPDEGFTEEGPKLQGPQRRRRSSGSGRCTIARVWRPLKASFVDEHLWHEGLGVALNEARCGHCACPTTSACHCTSYRYGVEWQLLEDLGLVYQLGHGGGTCIFPDDIVHEMTLIETPIIHRIKLKFCKCENSDDADNLQQLMRNGWYPATVTDPKTWEWDEMVTGHDPAGVDNTKLGECAVNCWACPHDGRNLPEHWRDVDPKFRFLYMLLLVVDANFRLKNRMRANEIDDSSLGPGWAYWVNLPKYRRHLKGYMNEKDISTCITFAALLQKDTRMTMGLHVSGVGGCVCARHKCMRPNGLGDLQKGERYSNMDFIVMSALMGFCLMMLTISYDIACQWKIHLCARMAKLPADMQLNLDNVDLQCALPVWHAASHNVECQNENSLSGALARATGRASSGRVCGHSRWQDRQPQLLKNVGQGYALQRKLVVALAERARQISGFRLVNRTVSAKLKKEWKKAVDDWAKTRRIQTRTRSHVKAEVRLDVRKDEDVLTVGGKAPLYGRSATVFLLAGIQIEDTQRRIVAELAGSVLVAADRENKIKEWQHTLLVKIARFRTLQKIYMPGIAETIGDAEEERDADEAPPKPEKVKLFMPSEMVPVDADDMLRGCVPGLVEMEVKLRAAQCANCLVSLRSRLHAKRHLIEFRDENVTGQYLSTKARTLIDQVGERVESHAKRYHKGRAALLDLKGQDAFPHFLELKPDDIRLDGDAGESDAAARKALGMITAGRGARRRGLWTMSRIGCTSLYAWNGLGHSLGRRGEWEGGAAVAAGAQAYALKQAGWHDRLGGFFRTKWEASALQTAGSYVAAESVENLEDFFDQYD
ncbi:hypothetical protein B0H17DRAFT_1208314 [Mycena rosella]|uniref:CxC2-like cysteine cluster KDZ transposase-associated domain-containing protein n=1 Tax=Mycena rosella TaxID=1033263 RepID=A0AAD7GAY3_MYCRO|nr:hypothetical protein B0H17DRAFT_1208314 [Mycena rosella]